MAEPTVHISAYISAHVEKITHLAPTQTIRISQKNALSAKEHFLPTENYVQYTKNGSINTRTSKIINDNNHHHPTPPPILNNQPLKTRQNHVRTQM